MSPGELKKKYSDDDKLPVKSFIYMEKILAIRLIVSIDENLKAIQGFITGSNLLSEEIQKLATQLINQQVKLQQQKKTKHIKFSNKLSNFFPDTR